MVDVINQSKLDMMDITKFECKLLLMQLLPSVTSVASAACIRILLHDLVLKSQRSLKAYTVSATWSPQLQPPVDRLWEAGKNENIKCLIPVKGSIVCESFLNEILSW